MCLGDNSFGDLGNGFTTAATVPVQVLGNWQTVQAVAAGDYHTCAVAGRDVLCWGHNSSGQLGDGTSKDSSIPVAVVGLP